MGILLKWKSKGSDEIDYDLTRIWRSTSETGAYAMIHTQAVSDITWYDPDGSTNNWYKITFYNTVTFKESSYSDAIQGGTAFGYCSVDDVRNISNLTSSDVTDTELCNLIYFASTQLNADCTVYIYEELINYIGPVKTNEIDGVKTTFYTKNFPLGDTDNNFKVTTADIEVYEIDGNVDPATKTLKTITSLDPTTGKFVVSSAPASDKTMIVTYRWCYRDMASPHPLVRAACASLAAAWAYMKLNTGKADHFRMGSISIARDMAAFDKWYRRYLNLLEQVNDRSFNTIATELII